MAQLWYLTLALRPSGYPPTRLRTDSRAAVGVEYGLLAALVAIAILGSLRGLGVSLTNLPLPSLITAFQGACRNCHGAPPRRARLGPLEGYGVNVRRVRCCRSTCVSAGC